MLVIIQYIKRIFRLFKAVCINLSVIPLNGTTIVYILIVGLTLGKLK